MKRLDLTGKKIGHWTIGESFKHYDGKIYYHCTCDCGTKRDVYGSLINSGKSKSCGCASRRNRSKKKKDRTGERYGSLTVIGNRVVNNRTLWICKCDCGNTVEFESNQLIIHKSCGCRRGVGDHIKESLSDYCVDNTYVPGLNRSTTNKNNTSGVTGVGYRADRGKWRAYIKFQKKDIFLGNYDTFEEAVAARRAGEEFYFGKYLEQNDENS